MALVNSVPEPRWFQGGKASNDNLLRSHQDVRTQYESFKERVCNIVGRRNVDSQVKHTKEEIEQQLRQLDPRALRELGDSNLSDSKSARLSYLEERSNGIKGFGSGLQKFLDSFSNFLAAYSGIVEVVKQAGQPYGQVAYGALSLLLIVAVNKSANEDKITKTLDDLCKWYPRLNDLNEIYPEPKLEECVAKVYRGGIMFAQSSVTYYTSSSVRFSMSVKPSKMELDATIAAIQQSLADVHSESRILLHKAVKSISGQNDELLRGNEELNRGNEELKRQMEQLQLRNDELKAEVQTLNQKASNKQKEDDWDNLESFRLLLEVAEENLCPEVDPSFCGRTLEKAFRNGPPSPRPSNSFSRMSLDLLAEDREYNQWISTTHSALFLLSGRTKWESRDGHNTCSWLSTASVHLVEKLRADDNLALFYSCHPDLRADCLVSWHMPLAALAYQALIRRPEVLRHDSRHLKSLVRRSHDETSDQKRLSLMVQTLRECLPKSTASSQKPVYIIIDRADLCDFPRPLKLHFLRQMVGLVKENSLYVKVMLVVDSVVWEGLGNLFDDLKDGAKERLFGHLEWHQKEYSQHLPSREWL